MKGEPARGVALALLPQTGGPVNPTSIPRAKSDENGRFRFTGVAAGSYSLQAIAPGYIGAGDQQFYPRGKTVNIADGETLEDVEIELKRGGAIAGRITDSNGRPLIEERITLNQLDPSGKPQSYNFYMGNSEMFLTDDRGEYRIFGLPEGRYVVSVGFSSQDGPLSTGGARAFHPRTYYAEVPNVTDASQAKAVEVTEGGEVTGVDIVLGEGKRTYDIIGRVVYADSGQPVAGLEIACGKVAEDRKNFNGIGMNGERSNANGEFRVRGLLPGRYGVFVRSTPESDFYSDPAMCEVLEENVQGIEVRVRLGTSIQGMVVLEGTNDPAVRLKLSQLQLHYAVRDPNRLIAPGMSSAKVAMDGGFRIRGVPPGKV
ncbi:MAG: MSCRAMM family protein, partial [Gammaproteobacteria bacterium]